MLNKKRVFISLRGEQKWLDKMSGRGYSLNQAGILNYCFDETQANEFRIRMLPRYCGFSDFCYTAEYMMVLNNGYQPISRDFDYYYFKRQINGDVSPDCFDSPQIILKMNQSLLIINLLYFFTLFMFSLIVYDSTGNVSDGLWSFDFFVLILFLTCMLYNLYQAIRNIIKIIGARKKWNFNQTQHFNQTQQRKEKHENN